MEISILKVTLLPFMTFLTIDQKDEETWGDQQEDKDKDIQSDLVTVKVTQLIIPDKLRKLNHGIEGQGSPFLKCVGSLWALPKKL